MSTDHVRSLWTVVQARNWTEMKSHFTADAVMDWPASGERFLGRDGIVAVNEHYPEGWSIEVLSVDELKDGRVVSRIKVTQAPNVFFAVSFFTLENGLITRNEEYWATLEEPEPWRNQQVIPGWERL